MAERISCANVRRRERTHPSAHKQIHVLADFIFGRGAVKQKGGGGRRRIKRKKRKENKTGAPTFGGWLGPGGEQGRREGGGGVTIIHLFKLI